MLLCMCTCYYSDGLNRFFFNHRCLCVPTWGHSNVCARVQGISIVHKYVTSAAIFVRLSCVTRTTPP